MLKIINFLIPISLIAVTVILFMGLCTLFKGGDFGRSNSNKLMRLRVLMQAIAVALLVGALWFQHRT